jgi:hypothetical protein
MLRSTLRRRAWILALPLLAAVTIASLSSQSPTSSPAASSGKPASPGTTGAAGLRVQIDQEHGGIVPLGATGLGALSDDLRQKLSRSAEGLEIVEHENGMRSVDLQGRFQSVSVLRIQPNGKKELECLDSPSDVERFLSAPATTTASDREVR